MSSPLTAAELCRRVLERAAAAVQLFARNHTSGQTPEYDVFTGPGWYLGRLAVAGNGRLLRRHWARGHESAWLDLSAAYERLARCEALCKPTLPECLHLAARALKEP